MYFTGNKKPPPYLTGAYGISYLCMVKYLSGATDTDGGWSFLFLQEDLLFSASASVRAGRVPLARSALLELTMRISPTFIRKGGMTMTVLDLMTVLSFGLTCFAIGYSIGSNRTAK